MIHYNFIIFVVIFWCSHPQILVSWSSYSVYRHNTVNSLPLQNKKLAFVWLKMVIKEYIKYIFESFRIMLQLHYHHSNMSDEIKRPFFYENGYIRLSRQSRQGRSIQTIRQKSNVFDFLPTNHLLIHKN